MDKNLLADVSMDKNLARQNPRRWTIVVSPVGQIPLAVYVHSDKFCPPDKFCDGQNVRTMTPVRQARLMLDQYSVQFSWL